MSTISKDNIAVIFNGTGIMAENASFISKNQLTPISILNRKGVVNQNTHGGIESNFSIAYIIEANDPIFVHSQFIKTGHQNIHFDGNALSIGGITGNCYLTDYSLEISPNQIVKGNASFISYNELTGTIQQKPNSNFNVLSGNGVLHGWTTYINSLNNNNPPTYDFNYSMSVNWKPIYCMGGVFPIQINLMGGKETFKMAKDYYTGIQFSGQNATGAWSTFDNFIRINELNYLPANSSYNNLTLNMSGAKITEIELQPSDDFVKVIGTAENYF